MKFKTKQFTEVEIEIELPYFMKRVTGNIFAILSNDKALKIENGIITTHYPESVTQFIGDGETNQITAGEFITAFDAAIEQLQSLKQFLNSK